MGRDAGQFKHGRYSKCLPDRLLAKYEAKMNDPDILSLMDEIALIDAKLETVLEEYEGSSRAWGRLTTLFADLRSGIHASDTEKIERCLDEMGTVIFTGRADSEQWSETMGLIGKRRELVESERRRAYDEHNAVTVDRLMVLIAVIVEIIRRNVKDKDVQRTIGEEIRRLISRGVVIDA